MIFLKQITYIFAIFIFPNLILTQYVKHYSSWGSYENINYHQLKNIQINDEIEVNFQYDFLKINPKSITFGLWAKIPHSIGQLQFALEGNEIICQTTICSIKFPKITQFKQYTLRITKTDNNVNYIIFGNLKVIVTRENNIKEQILKKTATVSKQKLRRFRFVPLQLQFPLPRVRVHFITLEQRQQIHNYLYLGKEDKQYQLNDISPLQFSTAYHVTLFPPILYQVSFLADVSQFSTFKYYWYLSYPTGLKTMQIEKWTFDVSYQTDIYDCPYNKSFPDTEGIFLGCSHQVPNCDLYFNEKQCNVCKIGYMKINNTKCSLIIEQCLSYNQMNDSLCDICNTSYRPQVSKTKCVQSTIQNCILYADEDNTKCQVCEINYYKLNSSLCKQNLNQNDLSLIIGITVSLGIIILISLILITIKCFLRNSENKQEKQLEKKEQNQLKTESAKSIDIIENQTM